MPKVASVAQINTYYENHFPRKAFCSLLARSWLGESQLRHREIALELHNNAYVRYRSVGDAEDLLCLFRKKRPAKVHTGAVFSNKPELKKEDTEVKPVYRELVFDIDVNDYSEYGIDSDDFDACSAAWMLVAFGLNVVTRVLKRHFGFLHALVVFSGRRGAHLTLYDKRACELNDEARSAIVAFLQPGGSAQKPSYWGLMNAPFFARLYKERVLRFFEKFCILPRREGGLGVLDTERDRQDFLDVFKYRDRFKPLSISGVTATEAWVRIKAYAKEARFPLDAERALQRAVLTYTWPRLDANVSKQMNHLSKAAFSVHPKTGLVCVPIDVNKIHTFKPELCPSVAGLVAGDEVETAALDAAVGVVSRFVEKIAASATEKWERKIKDCPLGLFRMPCPMTGRKRSGAGDPDSNQWMYPDRTRICYTLNRVFVALASDGDPNRVQIAFYTKFGSADDSTEEVFPGYAPPSRATADFPVDCFVEAAAEAACNPGETSIVAGAFVCALLHHRRTDRTAAVARLEGLREGLGELNFVCDLDTRKSREEQVAMLRCMAMPVWNLQQIFLR